MPDNSTFSDFLSEHGPNFIISMLILVFSLLSLIAYWISSYNASQRYRVVEKMRSIDNKALSSMSTSKLRGDLKTMDVLYRQGIKKYDDNPYISEEITRVENELKRRGEYDPSRQELIADQSRAAEQKLEQQTDSATSITTLPSNTKKSTQKLQQPSGQSKEGIKNISNAVEENETPRNIEENTDDNLSENDLQVGQTKQLRGKKNQVVADVVVEEIEFDGQEIVIENIEIESDKK